MTVSPNLHPALEATEGSLPWSLEEVRWRCRRGMLELDILLGTYASQVYPTLSPQDQTLFCRFIQKPDPDLYACLMGTPSGDAGTAEWDTMREPVYEHLVHAIRATA